jgi:proton-dependent oligopeptide transporter, POT family
MVDKVAHGGLGFGDVKAGSVYGLYVSMVYLLCLGGGWIADRVTGQRRAVLIGGIFIAAGEFCLVVPSEASFYAGLVLLMMGTGMLKGNVSTIVGQLYAKSDTAPRFRLFALLHGHQHRRFDLAADLRMGGRKDQLAVGIRNGRPGDAGGTDSVRARL